MISTLAAVVLIGVSLGASWMFWTCSPTLGAAYIAGMVATTTGVILLEDGR